MTLKEFETRYNLHDSFIESLNYDEVTATLTLVIDFAFWMQKDFKEGDEENGLIEVVFHNVKEHGCDNGDPTGDFVSILGAKADENSIVISLIDDECNDYMELKVIAESVEVKKVNA
jgi:hypothetical protein